MKIIHFGNVANVSYLLAYGLKRYLGCKTYLVMSSKPPPYHEAYYGYDSGNPYKVELVFTQGSVLNHVKSVLSLLLKEEIDIVHFHTRVALAADLLARIGRCRVVRHFHGSDLRHLSRKLRWLFSFLGEEKVLVSTLDLLSFIWAKAIPHSEWFPNPVDPFFCDGLDDQQEDENTVFLPTRHDEYAKRTSVAFEAWRFLKKLNPKAKMKTIMWGQEAEKFHKLFESDKRIVWLPVMTKQEYIRQLRSSSVVWGQFMFGILSVAELEAMAAGKPVITDLKRHLRHFSPPMPSYDSPQSIAQITDMYLKDESARKKFGGALRKWCLAHHSLEAVTRRLYDIYTEIL